MSLTRSTVMRIVTTYIEAWVTQDPELILSIFTNSAIYHERAFEAPIRGHAGIRDYWVMKVVQGQSNISCKVLSVYLDRDTAIVEWLAEFDDLVKGQRKQMKEIAVLECVDGKISTLREYWTSQNIGPV